MADVSKEPKAESRAETRSESRPEGRPEGRSDSRSESRGGEGRPSDRRGRPPAGGAGGKRPFFRRRKVCRFCAEKIDRIDYKDTRLLQQYVAERGRIIPRRISGACPQHQRRLCRAIKQARNIALLPFAAEV